MPNAPKTAGVSWVVGPARRIGTVMSATFDDKGVLKVEIACNYTDGSHYSLTFSNQRSQLEYSGSWSSNDLNRSSGYVDVKLKPGSNGGYLMSGNWHQYGETQTWETTEVAIAGRA